jgi:hypothetical protein
MRLYKVLITAALMAAASFMQADARVQQQILCFDPDMEFPVACDDGDDD